MELPSTGKCHWQQCDVERFCSRGCYIVCQTLCIDFQDHFNVVGWCAYMHVQYVHEHIYMYIESCLCMKTHASRFPFLQFAVIFVNFTITYITSWPKLCHS